jgi:Tfp pilus assembly protein PilO
MIMGGLSKREKIALIVVAIFAFALLYYNFVAIPQFNKLKTAQDTLNASKAKLNSLKESERNLQSIKAQVDELNTKLQDSLKAIPDTSKLPEIIMDLRNMTTESGCTIGKMGFGDPVSQGLNAGSQQQNPGQNTAQPNQNGSQSGGVIILPLNYEISGSYTSMMTLLSRMENSQRKMLVQRVTVAKGKETLITNFTIDFLYIKAGDPDKPIDYSFLTTTPGKTDMFN